MIDHQNTRETVREFNSDAEKAMVQIRQTQPA
jgi:hypothetical protein